MVTKLSRYSAVLLLWVVLLTVYLILHWLQIWVCAGLYDFEGIVRGIERLTTLTEEKEATFSH